MNVSTRLYSNGRILWTDETYFYVGRRISRPTALEMWERNRIPQKKKVAEDGRLEA